MNDVDYLVGDNAMDDFAYHRKWMGPMVGPLFEDDLGQQLLRRRIIVKGHNGGCKLGTKCKCWE